MARAGSSRDGRDDRDNAQARLSSPGRTRRSMVPRVRIQQDTFGQFAEGFARFMGTARFLAYMSLVIVVWVLWNIPFGPARPRFDAYPFIFLTLILSLQASYAAPLILLAQNRQEARDRVQLENDRADASQGRADMDYLAREIAGLRMSVGELATRDYLRGELRNELRSLLADLDEERDGDDPAHGPRPSQAHAGPSRGGQSHASQSHAGSARRATSRDA